MKKCIKEFTDQFVCFFCYSVAVSGYIGHVKPKTLDISASASQVL